MGIQNFPTILQPIIQQGFLEHEFQQALKSILRYRMVADREAFAVNIGETLTKTRAGLLPAATTPINPTAAAATPTGSTTNLDNGLVSQQWGVEQYTITINEYGATMDLNTVTQQVGIKSRFLQNAKALGEQAARTLDELARNALFGAYMGGNTAVRVSSTTTAVPVNDVRGFLFAGQNNQAVSGSNPLNIVIGAGAYTVTSVATDGTNVSTVPGGISGVLTLSAAVSAGDGAAGNAVQSVTAPVVIRPTGRTTSANLQATDVLTMGMFLDAKAALEVNAVPKIDGFYHAYLDPKSARQLFADPDFKLLFQGATAESTEFKKGDIADPFLGMRFLPTTEAIVQPHPSIAGATIRRPIVCGQGALIEGDFAGQSSRETETAIADVVEVDGVTMVTREPLDRLQQVVAQSWYWIGGFCAPTDLTTTAATIPTATSAALKRAVVLEHVG